MRNGIKIGQPSNITISIGKIVVTLILSSFFSHIMYAWTGVRVYSTDKNSKFQDITSTTNIDIIDGKKTIPLQFKDSSFQTNDFGGKWVLVSITDCLNHKHFRKFHCLPDTPIQLFVDPSMNSLIDFSGGNQRPFQPIPNLLHIGLEEPFITTERISEKINSLEQLGFSAVNTNNAFFKYASVCIPSKVYNEVLKNISKQLSPVRYANTSDKEYEYFDHQAEISLNPDLDSVTVVALFKRYKIKTFWKIGTQENVSGTVLTYNIVFDQQQMMNYSFLKILTNLLKDERIYQCETFTIKEESPD